MEVVGPGIGGSRAGMIEQPRDVSLHDVVVTIDYSSGAREHLDRVISIILRGKA
jgi:hypothetical protein